MCFECRSVRGKGITALERELGYPKETWMTTAQVHHIIIVIVTISARDGPQNLLMLSVCSSTELYPRAQWGQVNQQKSQKCGWGQQEAIGNGTFVTF
jgi:hypothetical protein